jgi:hypothetical protein
MGGVSLVDLAGCCGRGERVDEIQQRGGGEWVHRLVRRLALDGGLVGDTATAMCRGTTSGDWSNYVSVHTARPTRTPLWPDTPPLTLLALRHEACGFANSWARSG